MIITCQEADSDDGTKRKSDHVCGLKDVEKHFTKSVLILTDPCEMTNVWWSGSKYMQATGGTRLLLGLELPSTQDQLELDLTTRT